METQQIKPYNIYNVLVGMLLLVIIFSVFFANTKSIKNYNKYTFVLSSAQGVKLNQPVLIGGAKVGFVNNIVLKANNKAYVSVLINKQYTIPADSYVFVSSPSLFASAKSINIILGIEEDYLVNNDIIYNTNIGLDLDKLLDLVSLYLQANLKK